MNPAAIFFDIDDTLTNSVLAHIQSINLIWKDYGLPIEINKENINKDWITITNKYVKLFHKGKISLQEQRIKRIQELWIINGVKINELEAEKIYQNYHVLFLKSCKIFPDVLTTLEKLKDHRLGIISNGVSYDQIFKISNNKLNFFFEEIITSDMIGHSKPDREIFLYACEKFGVLPSKCLFIGDSYESDYVGGNNAGLKTILLDRNNTFCSIDIRKIHSLLELLKLHNHCIPNI